LAAPDAPHPFSLFSLEVNDLRSLEFPRSINLYLYAGGTLSSLPPSRLILLTEQTCSRFRYTPLYPGCRLLRLGRFSIVEGTTACQLTLSLPTIFFTIQPQSLRVSPLTRHHVPSKIFPPSAHFLSTPSQNLFPSR